MMPLKTPDEEYLKESAARARLRERELERRAEASRARFRWILWGAAALFAVALLADVRGLSSRMVRFQRTGKESRAGDAADIAGGMDGARYADPSGRFSLVPPRHWKRVKAADGFFDVVFQGPFNMDMGVQTVVTNGLTFDELVNRLRRVERALSAETHMDFAYVGKYRAVKRNAQLFRSRVLMLDFVTGDLAHHVQFSVPPELYDEYEPVFLQVMQTYEPGSVFP